MSKNNEEEQEKSCDCQLDSRNKETIRKKNCDCESNKVHKHHHDGHCDCHNHEGEKNCECDEHNDEHCDCGCEEEHNEAEDAFGMYEKAFRQLEDALIKADKEIAKEKQRADENEHIARCFRQDLERFKERNKNVEADLKQSVTKDTALKIIPILDNFDQALTKIDDEQTQKGFSMIYAKLQAVLNELGVTEIETENQEFNPEFHDCINKRKADNKKQSNKIATVYQKGYKFNNEDGKVIRHAVVEIYE